MIEIYASLFLVCGLVYIPLHVCADLRRALDADQAMFFAVVQPVPSTEIMG